MFKQIDFTSSKTAATRKYCENKAQMSNIMAIQIMEFEVRGYKTRKIFFNEKKIEKDSNDF
jgi:predicted ATPase